MTDKERLRVYLDGLGLKAGPFEKELLALYRSQCEADVFNVTPTMERYVYKFDFNLCMPGREMENADQQLKAINEETKESKKILQALVNEISAIGDIVGPALMDQAKAIRSNRMALVSEIRESLSALREIRKFFLESEYELEMARLERFVKLCREMKELKEAGVFDAVCDSAVRLAIQEES